MRTDREQPGFMTQTAPNGIQEVVGGWNALAYGLKFFRPDESTPFLKQRMAELRTRFPLPAGAPPSPPAPPASFRGHAETDWPGRVVVLVDRASGSAAEDGALMLRHYMGASIVGERTGGFIESGNIFPFPLPATGVTVGVPNFGVRFSDPRIAEGAGIPVDVALDDPAQPIGKVLEQLPAILGAYGADR